MWDTKDILVMYKNVLMLWAMRCQRLKDDASCQGWSPKAEDICPLPPSHIKSPFLHMFLPVGGSKRFTVMMVKLKVCAPTLGYWRTRWKSESTLDRVSLSSFFLINVQLHSIKETHILQDTYNTSVCKRQVFNLSKTFASPSPKTVSHHGTNIRTQENTHNRRSSDLAIPCLPIEQSRADLNKHGFKVSAACPRSAC